MQPPKSRVIKASLVRASTAAGVVSKTVIGDQIAVFPTKNPRPDMRHRDLGQRGRRVVPVQLSRFFKCETGRAKRGGLPSFLADLIAVELSQAQIHPDWILHRHNEIQLELEQSDR